jgi:hypothetical protein
MRFFILFSIIFCLSTVIAVPFAGLPQEDPGDEPQRRPNSEEPKAYRQCVDKCLLLLRNLGHQPSVSNNLPQSAACRVSDSASLVAYFSLK